MFKFLERRRRTAFEGVLNWPGSVTKCSERVLINHVMQCIDDCMYLLVLLIWDVFC